jgi:DNA-binding transcriptional regulator YdaS (Cro superfamily)
MGKSRANKHPVDRAIERAGSEHKLAEITGLTQPYINKAKKIRIGVDEPPINDKFAICVHHWSGGEIPAWEMRPDLWTPGSQIPEPVA